MFFFFFTFLRFCCSNEWRIKNIVWQVYGCAQIVLVCFFFWFLVWLVIFVARYYVQSNVNFDWSSCMVQQCHTVNIENVCVAMCVLLCMCECHATFNGIIHESSRNVKHNDKVVGREIERKKTSKNKLSYANKTH